MRRGLAEHTGRRAGLRRLVLAVSGRTLVHRKRWDGLTRPEFGTLAFRHCRGRPSPCMEPGCWKDQEPVSALPGRSQWSLHRRDVAVTAADCARPRTARVRCRCIPLRSHHLRLHSPPWQQQQRCDVQLRVRSCGTRHCRLDLLNTGMALAQRILQCDGSALGVERPARCMFTERDRGVPTVRVTGPWSSA
jgi:hypothetical protein